MSKTDNLSRFRGKRIIAVWCPDTQSRDWTTRPMTATEALATYGLQPYEAWRFISEDIPDNGEVQS